MLKLQCLLLPVLLFIANVLHAVEPSFIPLPDLDGRTAVNALSATGEVAVGSSGSHPFRWTSDTGMEALGDKPGFATDVSSDGTVVVGFEQESFPSPFRWRLGSGIASLITSGPDSHDQAVALGVSGDGNIAVGHSHVTAVRWGFDDRMIGLRNAIFGSEAVAASYDGSIVAGSMDNGGAWRREAVRWSDPGGFAWLGHLPGDTHSYATDITSDGRVIVGRSENLTPAAGFRSQGFLWTADEGMVALPFLPADISDDGRVMIGSTRVAGGQPVIWTPETGAMELQPFLSSVGVDLTGWTLTTVTAISGDGTTIAGQGFPPRPTTSGAWIAVIPEPSTWALCGTALMVALVGILTHHRRR